MLKVKTAKGVVLMIGSSLCISVMAGLIRYASYIDAYKIAFFRFVIGLALLGAAALSGKIKLRFVHGPFLFLRGLLGGTAVLAFFLSIGHLGIGKGTVLIYTFPIFASLFGAIFLKERITAIKLGFIIAAFVGIYFLTVGDSEGLSSFATFGKYDLIAIFGAICAGNAVVLVRRLHETDSTYAIFFAQCAIGLLIVVIPASVIPSSIGYTGGLILLCIGIIASVSQLFMSEGYRFIPVATGSLLGMLVPVLNFFIGVTIFHEPFSLRAIIGTAIVIASCVAVLLTGADTGEMAADRSPSTQ